LNFQASNFNQLNLDESIQLTAMMWLKELTNLSGERALYFMPVIQNFSKIIIFLIIKIDCNHKGDIECNSPMSIVWR
jgi:hypothetical protein